MFIIDIPSVILKQKEESMQARPPKEDLLFELNQFPPEGRFHLNQFLLVLSNARADGKWMVSDAVSMATFRELSAKEDLIEQMTDNFDVTLTLTHEVREGHEAVAWHLHSAPNLLTRNGYYTPRTSRQKQWVDLDHPLHGFARASQHEYSRLPYSGLTNEALVDLLGHYALTQTLRFRPESNSAQMPAGLLLLDLVCERLMTQAPPAQVAYPSNVYYPPHHMHNAFNRMHSSGSYAPPGSHWDFSEAQSRMAVAEFKSTPNLMEMMVHINRAVGVLCMDNRVAAMHISQEIHSAFKALGEGNWPIDERLYLMIGGNLADAASVVQGLIDFNLYSGWLIVNDVANAATKFCLYNAAPKGKGHGEMVIPVINFKFAVGDTLSDTLENIAYQMKAQNQIPPDAMADLLAQVKRVLAGRPIDSKEHVVLNFSMGPRSTFSEGLKRAMESNCHGYWIIYTDKTISDDTNDLPERFWFLGYQGDDLSGVHW